MDTNGTADPASAEIGDSRQYAIVDLRSKVKDVSATAVAIQLSGSSKWYSNRLRKRISASGRGARSHGSEAPAEIPGKKERSPG